MLSPPTTGKISGECRKFKTTEQFEEAACSSHNSRQTTPDNVLTLAELHACWAPPQRRNKIKNAENSRQQHSRKQLAQITKVVKNTSRRQIGYWLWLNYTHAEHPIDREKYRLQRIQDKKFRKQLAQATKVVKTRQIRYWVSPNYTHAERAISRENSESLCREVRTTTFRKQLAQAAKVVKTRQIKYWVSPKYTPADTPTFRGKLRVIM